LLKETISQLPFTDQIKTFYSICNGDNLFWCYAKRHSKANWVCFSINLIKIARQFTGLTEQEKMVIDTWDYKNTLSPGNNEAVSVVPGFPKKSLQPYAFIARHTDPKGLFQVFKKGKAKYFMSLTSQPIKVYREINKQTLIEVQSFEYRVESCHDGSMCVIDSHGKIQFIKKIDKFIEIDIN
jgi:hypothetical protein